MQIYEYAQMYHYSAFTIVIPAKAGIQKRYETVLCLHSS